jgi:hypothetical protein
VILVLVAVLTSVVPLKRPGGDVFSLSMAARRTGTRLHRDELEPVELNVPSPSLQELIIFLLLLALNTGNTCYLNSVFQGVSISPSCRFADEPTFGGPVGVSPKAP